MLAHTPPHPNIVQYYTSWTERGPSGGEYLFHQASPRPGMRAGLARSRLKHPGCLHFKLCGNALLLVTFLGTVCLVVLR